MERDKTREHAFFTPTKKNKKTKKTKTYIYLVYIYTGEKRGLYSKDGWHRFDKERVL